MKNLVLKTKYLVMSLIVTFTLSCSPEDGEQDPQGEQGAPGLDGNANVTSVLFEDQTINTGDNLFNIPELNQDIFDNGIVYTYVTVTGNDYWETLPLSLGGDTILEIDRIEVGSATLRATFTQSNLRLRFILVAGTPAGKNAVDVSKLSYEEAMDYFGLEI
ncbi:hypothetical protein [uncultured Lacinutrix sp.]|uniref:hypothetical protein n=1 Tax=uncultured Lacinutrix sp. TaxID=574032 RepID=UPI00260938C7|nr:hypothetical protein [uncultured Lacinutrix sp.]